jgi:S1-C subfamily serine protease
MPRIALGLALLVALVCAAPGVASPPPDSPRRTRNVEIIERCGASVVAVFAMGKENSLNSGSGSVIHRDGYILTNDHVVQDRQGVVVVRGQPPLPFRTIGRLPEKDLALIKVDSPRPFVTVPLGRSDDLLAGEPILAGGNPGGRGIVFSAGIVSSPSVMAGASALAMSSFPDDTRDRMIQFDAASNPGNSGGALINAEGQQVGVVAGKILQEQNINFAIPIDRVHQSMRDLLLPEERGNFWTGIDLETASARIGRVRAGSPAARAGFRAGDTITAMGAAPVQSAVDFYVALCGRGQKARVSVKFTRDQETREASIALEPYPAKAGLPAEGRERGLRYRMYRGRFTRCPDFDRLTPAAEGTVARLKLGEIAGLPDDEYALVLEGYVDIPETGVWALAVGSDDGSRLYVHSDLLVANDGPHPMQWSSGRLRLGKGLHPIRIEYFEATGDADIQVTLAQDGSALTQAPEFFVDKPKGSGK